MTDFYITVKNTDSIDYYPDNKLTYFRVKLQDRIRLSGKWYVSLAEVFIDVKRDGPIYVCSNITSNYRVGGNLSSALRLIQPKGKHIIYENPYYIKVDGSEYDTFEFYLMSLSGDDVSFEGGELVCTLHFKTEL